MYAYIHCFRLTLALAVSAMLIVGRSLNRCVIDLYIETIVASFPIDQKLEILSLLVQNHPAVPVGVDGK